MHVSVLRNAAAPIPTGHASPTDALLLPLRAPAGQRTYVQQQTSQAVMRRISAYLSESVLPSHVSRNPRRGATRTHNHLGANPCITRGATAHQGATRSPPQQPAPPSRPSPRGAPARAAAEELDHARQEAEVRADGAAPLEGEGLLARDLLGELRPRLVARLAQARRRLELVGDVGQQHVAPADGPMVAEGLVLLQRDGVELVALARVRRRLPTGTARAGPRVGGRRDMRGRGPRAFQTRRCDSPRAAGGSSCCGSAAGPPRCGRRRSRG